MSDEPTIQPALTPEQWTKAQHRIEEYDAVGWHAPPYFLAEVAQWQRGEPMDRGSTHASSRHALAALSLHGQPYGFTHDDVELLRQLVEPDTVLGPAGVADLQRLADRIAALLPPTP